MKTTTLHLGLYERLELGVHQSTGVLTQAPSIPSDFIVTSMHLRCVFLGSLRYLISSTCCFCSFSICVVLRMFFPLVEQPEGLGSCWRGKNLKMDILVDMLIPILTFQPTNKHLLSILRDLSPSKGLRSCKPKKRLGYLTF